MTTDNSQKAAESLRSAFARKPETAAARRADGELENETSTASRLEGVAKAAAQSATPEPAPAPAPTPELEPVPAGVQHTVQSGETLSHISLHYYKTANRWKEIYEANKAVIGDNPNRIYPGQVLVIPNA